MEFEFSHETAERLHVNVRTIQKWAKEGKLPGATRMGKSWMIPKGLIGPTEPVDTDFGNYPARSILNTEFLPGECEAFIQSLDSEGERSVAYGAYYYFSGQPEKALTCIESYLNHKNESLALSANIIYSFAAMALGEVGQKLYMIEQKAENAQAYIERMMKDERPEMHAVATLFHETGAALMHLPLTKDNLRQQLKFLPEGLRLFGAYVMAHDAYLHHEYERALGISEAAAHLIGGTFPIAQIYILLMAAASSASLKKIEQARRFFLQAWDMGKKDGFIEPFADHHVLLHGLTESCLKKRDPEGFERIIQATRRFKKSWMEYHEKAAQKVLTDNLSATEFSVAMMYNKGWTTKEIADNLDISVRMVKHHLSVIYEKLGVSSRDELSEYMPR